MIGCTFRRTSDHSLLTIIAKHGVRNYRISFGVPSIVEVSLGKIVLWIRARVDDCPAESVIIASNDKRIIVSKSNIFFWLKKYAYLHYKLTDRQNMLQVRNG